MRAPRYSAAQHALRLLGSVVPLGTLGVLALPLATWRGVRYAAREGRARSRRLSRLHHDGARGDWPWLRVAFERTRTELTWLSWIFRDRFHRRRWQRRIGWVGARYVTSAIEAGRPVIIATVHVGPLTFLGRWMTCRGWRTGVVADQTGWIDTQARRTAAGVRIAPRVFLPSHARRVLRFLRRGGVLIVAMDFPRGRQEPVGLGGCVLRISTGALRLARTTGAAVVPCIAVERWFWRATVRCSPALPDELVMDERRHPEACARIAAAIQIAVRESPHQAGDLFLDRLEPVPARPPVELAT